MLPDPEAVDGIAKTFEMWKAHNWRLAVPDGQLQLAVHSAEAAALKRDEEGEAAVAEEDEYEDEYEDEEEEYEDEDEYDEEGEEEEEEAEGEEEGEQV